MESKKWFESVEDEEDERRQQEEEQRKLLGPEEQSEKPEQPEEKQPRKQSLTYQQHQQRRQQQQQQHQHQQHNQQQRQYQPRQNQYQQNKYAQREQNQNQHQHQHQNQNQQYQQKYQNQNQNQYQQQNQNQHQHHQQQYQKNQYQNQYHQQRQYQQSQQNQQEQQHDQQEYQLESSVEEKIKFSTAMLPELKSQMNVLDKRAKLARVPLTFSIDEQACEITVNAPPMIQSEVQNIVTSFSEKVIQFTSSEWKSIPLIRAHINSMKSFEQLIWEEDEKETRITLRGKKFLITKCSELISHQLSQHLWINENQVEYLKRFAFDQLVEICKNVIWKNNSKKDITSPLIFIGKPVDIEKVKTSASRLLTLTSREISLPKSFSPDKIKTLEDQFSVLLAVQEKTLKITGTSYLDIDKAISEIQRLTSDHQPQIVSEEFELSEDIFSFYKKIDHKIFNETISKFELSEIVLTQNGLKITGFSENVFQAKNFLQNTKPTKTSFKLPIPYLYQYILLSKLKSQNFGGYFEIQEVPDDKNSLNFHLEGFDVATIFSYVYTLKVEKLTVPLNPEELKFILTCLGKQEKKPFPLKVFATSHQIYFHVQNNALDIFGFSVDDLQKGKTQLLKILADYTPASKSIFCTPQEASFFYDQPTYIAEIESKFDVKIEHQNFQIFVTGLKTKVDLAIDEIRDLQNQIIVDHVFIPITLRRYGVIQPNFQSMFKNFSQSKVTTNLATDQSEGNFAITFISIREAFLKKAKESFAELLSQHQEEKLSYSPNQVRLLKQYLFEDRIANPKELFIKYKTDIYIPNSCAFVSVYGLEEGREALKKLFQFFIDSIQQSEQNQQKPERKVENKSETQEEKSKTQSDEWTTVGKSTKQSNPKQNYEKQNYEKQNYERQNNPSSGNYKPKTSNQNESQVGSQPQFERKPREYQPHQPQQHQPHQQQHQQSMHNPNYHRQGQQQRRSHPQFSSFPKSNPDEEKSWRRAE